MGESRLAATAVVLAFALQPGVLLAWDGFRPSLVLSGVVPLLALVALLALFAMAEARRGERDTGMRTRIDEQLMRQVLAELTEVKMQLHSMQKAAEKPRAAALGAASKATRQEPGLQSPSVCDLHRPSASKPYRGQ